MTPADAEPFVGRESEMAELTAALDDALSGRGSLAVIAGEPGIGKTGILEAFELVATERGARVLWGRCYEESGAPPYWPWVQAIRTYIRDIDESLLLAEMGPGASDIANIVPELREILADLPEPPPSDDPNAARFRLFDSIASFLRKASDRQPLVMLLEDLHAADGDSLLLLEFVARELSDTNLLIVGTYRDIELGRRHPLSRTLAELRRSSRFRRMLLRRLDRAAVAEFVASTLGATPPPGVAEAIFAETEGNPLFVTETLRLMRQEGRLSLEALQNFSPGDLPLPEGVREAIGRRLDGLSDTCNELLTVAAVMGRQFEFRHLASLTKDPPQGARPQLAEDELVDLLDEAIEARVLEETSAPGADYQFTHALIKETLTDEISITRKARLHARVALMLEELYGEDPGQHAAQLAFHFGEAENVLGSERLIRYSLIAGNHSLAAYAHEEALVHLQRGLSAKEGQQDDLETAELLHGLGRAKVMALLIEQQDDGLRHLLRALNIFVDAGLIDQALAIPEQIEPRRAGANDLERRLYSRALEVSPENSPAAALNLAKYGATLALGTGDFDAGRDAIARAIEIASRRGDARLEAQILLAQAALEAWATNWQKLAEITNRADSLIDANVDPLISGRIGFLSCAAAFFDGDLAHAVRRAQTARASAIAVRDAHTISGCIWIEASALAFSGAWDQARELVDEARQSIGMDSRVLGVAAKIESEIGEFDTAAVYLQQIDTLSEYYSSEPTFRRYFAIGSYADAAYVTGDTANLIRTKERATATAQDPTRTPLVESSAIYALALVAVMEDDSEAAAELVPAVEQSGTSMTPFGQSNRIAGLAARTAGQFEESVAHFERALAFLEKSGYAAEKAWALHNYAETLLGRNADGDMTRAAEFNAEAATLAEKFGMNPLLARAQALQATIGAAPVASDGHPAGLSAREIEVIQLVAAGKSNREIAEALIISLNTVTHHMTSIFNKTDSANRAEAAAFATRNGIA